MRVESSVFCCPSHSFCSARLQVNQPSCVTIPFSEIVWLFSGELASCFIVVLLAMQPKTTRALKNQLLDASLSKKVESAHWFPSQECSFNIERVVVVVVRRMGDGTQRVVTLPSGLQTRTVHLHNVFFMFQ